MNNFLDQQTFHLIGIKGVAMTALALILVDMGKTVTGSDVKEIFQTDLFLKQRQIKVFTNFSKDNIKFSQVVIYSAGHNARKNIEVKEAIRQKKIVLCLAQVIGYLTSLKENVSICGSHGKTTTTALISFVFDELGLFPSYLVGSAGFMDRESGKWGNGDLFISEADEYLADPDKYRISKFLFFNPKYLICTNIDFDHPDFFSNLAQVKQAFLEFFKKLNPAGKLIINGDDGALLNLAKKSNKPFLSYGFSVKNDYVIVRDSLSFHVLFQDKLLAKITPKLMGRCNMLNITASVILFDLLKVDLKQAVAKLEKFKGARRRLELIDSINDNLIFDDYAHHPTEIEASIEAIKSSYPNYKIAVCFQPHTYSRTKRLLNEFGGVFEKVDYLGLLPIFASAREKIDKEVSSDKIIEKVNSKVSKLMLKTDQDWLKLVQETQASNKNWIYITMGAGDVYEKTSLLSKYLHEQHSG